MLDSADMMRLFRCSKTSLWRYVKDGDVPAPIKLGGSSLWREQDILAWLAAKEKPRHRAEMDDLA